jgi:hypothetical protein
MFGVCKFDYASWTVTPDSNASSSSSFSLCRFHLCGSTFAKESAVLSLCPFVHFLSVSPRSTSSFYATIFVPVLGFFPQSSLFSVILFYSVLHSFGMSEPPQSISLILILYVLHPELFDVCILILSLWLFPIIDFKTLISVACILLSFPLVRVHVRALCNSIFWKFTLCIVVLHFLCLSSVICSLLNDRIVWPLLFFHLFHSVISPFFCTKLLR